MFEFFFLISILFLVFSGELNAINLDKRISVFVLLMILFISLLPDIIIKYTFRISPVGILIILLTVFMFILINKERIYSSMCSLFIALFMWAIIYWIPSANMWYIKSIIFSFVGAMLSATYFQGSFISVGSCILLELFQTISLLDIELIYIDLFTLNNKTSLIISLILPFVIIAISHKKVKNYSEGIYESTV